MAPPISLAMLLCSFTAAIATFVLLSSTLLSQLGSLEASSLDEYVEQDTTPSHKFCCIRTSRQISVEGANFTRYTYHKGPVCDSDEIHSLCDPTAPLDASFWSWWLAKAQASQPEDYTFHPDEYVEEDTPLVCEPDGFHKVCAPKPAIERNTTFVCDPLHPPTISDWNDPTITREMLASCWVALQASKSEDDTFNPDEYVEQDLRIMPDRTFRPPYDPAATVLSDEELCLIEVGFGNRYDGRRKQYENWPTSFGRSIWDCQYPEDTPGWWLDVI